MLYQLFLSSRSLLVMRSVERRLSMIERDESMAAFPAETASCSLSPIARRSRFSSSSFCTRAFKASFSVFFRVESIKASFIWVESIKASFIWVESSTLPPITFMIRMSRSEISRAVTLFLSATMVCFITSFSMEASPKLILCAINASFSRRRLSINADSPFPVAHAFFSSAFSARSAAISLSCSTILNFFLW